jgi:hypothetical protein
MDNILEQAAQQQAQSTNTATETKGRSVLTRKVEREIIAGMRHVETERGAQVVITTESGKEIWGSVNQVPSDAEEVRFRNVKAGDIYKYGQEERVVKNDSAWFVSAGRQTVRSYDALTLQNAKIEAVMSKMAEFGLNNAINL